MDLNAYLQRINYTGPREPSLPTLQALHRAHMLAIPYENIDVQLGRTLTLDVEAMYEKIVERRRGGWCYEMNGLFAWVLREIGFDVEHLGAGVNACELGPSAMMGHLVLRVRLDQPYLADVGFGNGFVAPIPLREGTHTDGAYQYRLERTADGWRFHNNMMVGGNYDFYDRAFALTDFAAKCHWQQTSPESKFVQSLVLHQYGDTTLTSLRGMILQQYTVSEVTEQTVQSSAHLAEILDHKFALRPPEIDELWERISRRHAEWLTSRERVG